MLENHNFSKSCETQSIEATETPIDFKSLTKSSWACSCLTIHSWRSMVDYQIKNPGDPYGSNSCVGCLN